MSRADRFIDALLWLVVAAAVAVLVRRQQQERDRRWILIDTTAGKR